jgi:hypothetical protein
MAQRIHLPCKNCTSESIAHLMTEKKPKSVMRYYACRDCGIHFETIEHVCITPDAFYSRGSNNPNSILREQDVLNIREKHNSGLSVAEIAVDTGMGKKAIRDIITGKTWKHV